VARFLAERCFSVRPASCGIAGHESSPKDVVGLGVRRGQLLLFEKKLHLTWSNTLYKYFFFFFFKPDEWNI
jgi:hypothetical protein